MIESEHGSEQTDLPPEHPLLLELSSFRTALARYQHELHNSTTKASQLSHTSSQALERAHTLSRENTVLRTEIATLRACPDISPHPAQHQVSELSLSLRHMSDKLTATEEKLVDRTLEVARAETERRTALAELHHAHERIDAARAAEAHAKQEVLQVSAQLRATEEDLRLSDNALREYADLVRSLEAQIVRSGTPSRHITDSSSTLVTEASLSSESLHSVDKALPSSSEDPPAQHLSQARTELQNLISASLSQEHQLSSEISQLKASLSDLRAASNAASDVHETDLTMLANLRAVVDRMSIDDATSAKMVSRYMKFSQSSTNTLQSALAALKARHTASLETLHFQLAGAEKELALERTSNAELRRQVEDTTEDLAREAYGRRREVALRLRLVSREEKVAQDLRQCARELQDAIEDEESFEDVPIQDIRDGRRLLLDDLDAILNTLDGPLTNHDSSSSDHHSSGSLGRVLFAEDSARTLMIELDQEIAHWRLVKHPLGTQERAISPIETLVPGTPLEVLSNQIPADQPLLRVFANASTQTEQRVEPQSTILSSSSSTSAADKATLIFVPTGPSSQGLTVSTTDPRELQSSPISIPHVTIELDSPNAADNVEDLNTPLAVITQGLDRSGASSRLEAINTIHDPTSSITPTHRNHITTNPNIPTLEDSPSTSSSISTKLSELPLSSPSIATHPLVTQLQNINHRYTDFQQSFQELHLTLTALKSSLSASPLPTSLDSTTASTLLTVVNRLDDVNEDVRVELEIQVADEERLAEGYIALLSLASLSPSDDTSIEGLDKEEVQQFVDGKNPKIARALLNFARKKEELEHDVAEAKRVFDAHSTGFTPSPSLSPEVRTTSLSSTIEEDVSTSLPAPRGRQWSTWTEGLFSSSRASSPAPPPKFGSVLTMPRSLRPSASATSLRSALGLASPDPYSDPKIPEPLAKLGLNLHTPMPTHLSAPTAPARPITPINLSQHIPRPRYPSMFGHHQSILGTPAGRSIASPGPRAASMPFSAFVAARSPFGSPAPDSGRAEVNLNVDSMDDDVE